VTGIVTCGRDCSINPYAVVRGNVKLGDGVRVGAHASILGFNHTMAPGIEVFRQPLTSRGIVVGDDVWVGSHVVVLDGVTVGSHAVLAAGAIVTKDVPAGAVVAGNPARFLRWRVTPAGDPATGRIEHVLAELAERARHQLPQILERAWDASLSLYRDRAGTPPTVRAQCDAIELSFLLSGAPPSQLIAEAQVDRLRGWQHPVSGLVPSLDVDGRPAEHADPDDPDVAYHVLCVGYALDLLGSEFAIAPRAYSEATLAELVRRLDALTWDTDPWNAGHWVDALGTAELWARRRGESSGGMLEALFGWLTTRCDPVTGMWGSATSDQGLRLVVNGFYRASRGTFAQFGVGLPNPHHVVDTVLEHVTDERWFSPLVLSACGVLDIAHPSLAHPLERLEDG
jgi:carbonic anhydrase/acetyltransferase-like protein (isoleucine patch superfamily)